MFSELQASKQGAAIADRPVDQWRFIERSFILGIDQYCRKPAGSLLLLETQRGIAAPYIGLGQCRIWCLPLGGSATHERLQHWRWENISAQALELIIWINRNSQLTISVICLKLLYQNIIEPTDLVHKHAHLHRIAFGKTIIKISSGPIWIMLGI